MGALPLHLSARLAASAAKGFGWEIDWRDNFVATDLPRFPVLLASEMPVPIPR